MTDPAYLSADTLISLGTAIVVIAAAVRITRSVTNMERDLRLMLKRADFKVWVAQAQRTNPLPDFEESST